MSHLQTLHGGIRNQHHPGTDDAKQKGSGLPRRADSNRGHAAALEPILGYVARRGLRCKRLNPVEHLFLPAPGDCRLQDQLYDRLKKYSFRLFLRDLIKRRSGFSVHDLHRYCSRKTVSTYLGFLKRLGVLEELGPDNFRLGLNGVYSFGDTLEWFVAQVLAREFYAVSSWGVTLEGTCYGGDYDVLATAENRAIYVEVKSSPPKQMDLTEVRSFLNRFEDLGPDLSIFLEDTQLRLEDKILPLFSAAMEEQPHLNRANANPERLPGGDVFTWGNRLFVMNAEPDLVRNLGLCLRRFFGRRGQ